MKKIDKKVFISWLLVILWMFVIFFFSGVDANESNNQSLGTLDKVIGTTIDATNKVGITDKHPSESKMKQVVEFLNKPFRKCMHASVYLVLVLLFINAFKVSNFSLKQSIIFSLICCFLYACSDEFHQTFIDGRSGQFSDVLIDTCGALIGTFFYTFIYSFIERKKLKKVAF